MEQEKPQELKFIKKHRKLIENMRELSLDFNHLFVLECFKYQEDKEFFKMFTIPSIKDFNLSTAYQWLVKNEYLVQNPNNTSEMIVSVKGEDMLLKLKTEHVLTEGDGTTYSSILVDFSPDPEKCFEEWWKAYPTNPGWKSDDGNTVFAGSRVLKNLRKDKAKERYLKLLNQGLKHEELLGSLLYEIKLKKVDSIKKGQNQMEYFKGLEAYLNSERYLLFIDNYKDNPEFVKSEKVKGKKQNVTDI